MESTKSITTDAQLFDCSREFSKRRMFNIFLALLSVDTLVNRMSFNLFVLCQESLVLQAAGQLLGTETRHAVVFFK